MIDALAGPFLAGSALLVAAGGAKLARPHDTARALAAAGLPGRPWLVRAGALVEAAIGVWALAAGGVAAALVGVSFLGFGVFIVLALRRRWPIASCGCFGRPDRPPSVLHAAVDIAAAALALGWAAGGGGGIGDALAGQPWAGIPLLAGAAVACWFTYLILAHLPVSGAFGRRVAAGDAR